MRALPLIFITRGPRVLGNHNWIQLQNRKVVRIQTGEQICLSVDRPCLLVDRSVDRDQQSAKLCQLVDLAGRSFSLPRLTGRSTGLHLCTWSCRSTGRLTGPCSGTCCKLPPRSSWILISALSRPMSLKTLPMYFISSYLLSPDTFLHISFREFSFTLICFYLMEIIFSLRCSLVTVFEAHSKFFTVLSVFGSDLQLVLKFKVLFNIKI